MHTRIKELRKSLHLTQAEFAKRIGLKQNTVALIESGKRNTSERAILSICREFHLNKNWLLTGEGEKYAPSPTESPLDALMDEYYLSYEDTVLIEKFIALKESSRKAVIQYVLDVADAINNGDLPFPQYSAPDPNDPDADESNGKNS